MSPSRAPQAFPLERARPPDAGTAEAVSCIHAARLFLLPGRLGTCEAYRLAPAAPVALEGMQAEGSAFPLAAHAGRNKAGDSHGGP